MLGYGSDHIAWVKQNLVDDMVHFLKEVNPGYGDTKIKELMNLVADALDIALLKEQEKQKFFVDESGKITPLPVVVRCKDCKWYDERISMCDNCGLPREQTFFCADGKRK